MALLAGFCRTTHGAAAPGSSQQMAVLRIVARQQRWRPPGRSAQSLPPHAPHDGAQQTTQVLEERRVGEVSRLLYVASGVLNISEVMALHRQRFVVMTKARFTLEIQPDVASAVDYAVCATASLFVGNAYSAFSYLLREGALVRGAAERAGYYNLDASDGGGELGDITRREAVRWGVLPLGTRQLGAG